MSTKPIFVATHPRSCSTAFERVFMTKRDTLKCIHEPFGDAFYFGPERLSDRFANDPEGRESSSFASTTYNDVLARLSKDASEGKRVFIKDMSYYLFPPKGAPATLAPSLVQVYRKGSAEPGANGTNGFNRVDEAAGLVDANAVNGASGIIATKAATMPFGHGEEAGRGKGDNLKNPTVVPTDILRQFHFTFLIRHPRHAIPSYWRCTVPPLSGVTGFSNFDPSEAGYDELRRLFDFLKRERIITADGNSNNKITVVDADDLLDHPEEVVRAYCADVSVSFTTDMLRWEDAESQAMAERAFAKWSGFHEDVIKSTCLRARSHERAIKTRAEEDDEWREKYGAEAQKVIRKCVDRNIPDYEYLKSFALKV